MKPKNETPTALEWALWNAWAASHGIGPDDRQFIFGQTFKAYSREQAAQRLAQYARQL